MTILGCKLDASRVMTALCGTVAMLIAYWVALRLEWNPGLAAITVAIMYGATWGTTLDKVLSRLLGTIVGAVMGVVMVAAFAHDRELFIGAMSLWTAFCVWGVQGSERPYAWLVTLLSTAILGWPGGLNPSGVFESSIVRLSTTILGLVLSGLAFGVIWPLRADRKFEAAVDKLLSDVKQLLIITHSCLLNPDQKIEDAKSLQTEIIVMSTTLPQLLANARIENSRIKRNFANYEVLCERLEDFTLAAASIANVVTQDDFGLVSAEGIRIKSYDNLFRELDQCCVSLLEQFDLARDAKPIPQQQEADRDSFDSWLSVEEDVAPPAEGLLVERCHLFHRSASQALHAIDNLQALPKPGNKPKSLSASKIDWETKLHRSLLAVVQLVVATYFLLIMNWPLALHIAIVPIVVLILKNSTMPVSVATGTLVKSLLTILPVAAFFHFLVMPHLDSFEELAPLLAILFLYLLYGMSSPNPFRSLTSLIQVIVINILVSVSPTPPTYKFDTFTNLYLGLSGGFFIVVLITSLFETRNPRSGFLKLVSAICNDLSVLFRDVSKRPESDLDCSSRRLQHSLLNQYMKMKQLYGVIKYRTKPGIQAREIEAVIDSVGTLILRVIWIDITDRLHERQSIDIDRLYSLYVGIFAATGHSLSQQRSVNVDSIDDELLHRLDSSEAYLFAHKSLVKALTDFQRNLNALDWAEWTKAYF
ncbi:FUSC family protein [Gimesia sp.]|uniref:FUSC family protein n=1 Tax=Gimesia sp. TaxID=2024833 RepID=UPI0032EB2628